MNIFEGVFLLIELFLTGRQHCAFFIIYLCVFRRSDNEEVLVNVIYNKRNIDEEFIVSQKKSISVSQFRLSIVNVTLQIY